MATWLALCTLSSRSVLRGTWGGGGTLNVRWSSQYLRILVDGRLIQSKPASGALPRTWHLERHKSSHLGWRESSGWLLNWRAVGTRHSHLIGSASVLFSWICEQPSVCELTVHMGSLLSRVLCSPVAFPAAVLVLSRVSQVCPQALLMICNNSYFREFALKNISLFYTLSKRKL